MMELLRKGFWQDLKKTFDEARGGPPPQDKPSQSPADSQTDTPSPAEAPPAPEAPR